MHVAIWQASIVVVFPYITWIGVEWSHCTWPSHSVTPHQNPKSDLVPRCRYTGTMLRSYSYTHSLSSATWHPGPVPMVGLPIPMVPYPYPYPYLWSRTHTRTRTHDFITCRTRTHTRTHGLVSVPVPIPMVSNPYPYPYPWPRTHTRTRTHDPYPHYKSAGTSIRGRPPVAEWDDLSNCSKRRKETPTINIVCWRYFSFIKLCMLRFLISARKAKRSPCCWTIIIRLL